MTTSFADLGVPARLVDALAAAGIAEPFPVQEITLADALAGRDLCGRAPTGSGKTLGFGIPLMARISQAEPTKPTGLVLVPTRELAEQVQRAFVPLGRAQWRFIQAIYGGASFGPQIHSLRKGASVIVATPGRLIDIIEKGYCDLSAVEVCVIDEADRMADLGFMPDVRKILDMTPATRQTMLWSATLDGDVNELINEYMTDPVRHDLINDEDLAPVDHRFVVTRPTERLDATVALIEEHGPTIVFVKTRFGVDDVCDDLNRAGVRAGALHGARSQALRQRTLEDFRRGKIQALVATDVAARGIHVDNVSLVLHYDLPDNDKDYTHRSGRTGRAGAAGLVIAFVPPSRQRIAQRMSDAVSADVTWERGEKPVQRIAPEDRSTGSRDRGDRDRNDRGDRRDSYVRADRSDRDDRPGRFERNDRNERFDRPQRVDRGERGDRTERPRTEWSERNRGADRPAARRDANDWSPPEPSERRVWTPTPPRDDRADRGRGFERNDRFERNERTDRSDRFGKVPGARDTRDGGDAFAQRPFRERNDERGPRRDDQRRDSWSGPNTSYRDDAGRGETNRGEFNRGGFNRGDRNASQPWRPDGERRNDGRPARAGRPGGAVNGRGRADGPRADAAGSRFGRPSGPGQRRGPAPARGPQRGGSTRRDGSR